MNPFDFKDKSLSLDVTPKSNSFDSNKVFSQAQEDDIFPEKSDENVDYVCKEPSPVKRASFNKSKSQLI